jgi:hypothetical protein
MNSKFSDFQKIQDSVEVSNELAKKRLDSLREDLLSLQEFKFRVSNATAENKKYWVRENWLRVGIMAGVVGTFVKMITAEPRN